MRFENDNDQSNVEDRRGESGGGGGGGFLGGGMRLGLGGTVILGILSLVLGRNLFSTTGLRPSVSTGGGRTGRSATETRARVSAEEDLKQVAVKSFNDAQRLWAGELKQRGQEFRPAKLVLFWDQVRSGCGGAAAAMGPFYCPADERVYIDLGFYRELAQRFKAPGDFAQAYVIAHEVGHHMQNVLGIEPKVRRMQRQNPRQRNQLSILMELQADCFAGVWGHSAQQRHLLEAGDVDEGLGAAAAVGDDRIQKQATGRVSPESWTHGSAAQRTQWFKRGMESGRLEDCDTFAQVR